MPLLAQREEQSPVTTLRRVEEEKGRTPAAPEDDFHNEALRALGQYSAYLIHELRAPLQAVNAQVQVLQQMLRQQGESRHETRFSLIYGELQRASELVDQYLQLGAVNRGRRQPVELAELARQTVQLLRSLCISRRVEVTVEAEEDIPPLPGDEQRLRQLLVNLIINAVQAQEQGGRITVSVEQHTGHQILRVADQGPGLAPEDMERLFQPYFTTKERGTGLGLPWCRQIAEEHGGGISGHNRSDGLRGAVFVVTLPAAEPVRGQLEALPGLTALPGGARNS